MSTPASVIAATASLDAAFSAAWDIVDEAQDSIISDPRPWRRVGKRGAFLAAFLGRMDDMDEQASVWFAERMPDIYAAGASDAARALGLTYEPSPEHLARISALAAVGASSLLKATRGARRTTRALMAVLAGNPGLLARPSPELTALVEKERPFAVRYADQSRHGLDDFASMVLDTAASSIYTAGTLGMGAEAGVTSYYVSDGAFCGWSFHDDPDRADGTIRSEMELVEFPLAHPHCRRSASPSPDAAPLRDIFGNPVSVLSPTGGA